MRIFLLNLLFISLFSCHSPTTSPIKVEPVLAVKTWQQDTIFIRKNTFTLYDNVVQFLEMDNTVHFSKQGTPYLVDSIDSALEKIGAIKLLPLNRDNFYDIAIKTVDLDIDLDYWYCYDSTAQIFRKIEGIEWVASPSRLSTPKNYFFTFSPNGEDIWSSELFYIQGHQAHILAALTHVYKYGATTEGVQEEYSYYENSPQGLVEKPLLKEDIAYFLKEDSRLEDCWLYLIKNWPSNQN